jgi:hypothetical protein
MSSDLDVPPAATFTQTTAATLERQFPGVVVWYGHTTRHWWALLFIGQWVQLIEGHTPEQLAHAIGAARSWMRRR